jgi:hypothetical protein
MAGKPHVFPLTGSRVLKRRTRIKLTSVTTKLAMIVRRVAHSAVPTLTTVGVDIPTAKEAAPDPFDSKDARYEPI